MKKTAQEPKVTENPLYHDTRMRYMYRCQQQITDNTA